MKEIEPILLLIGAIIVTIIVVPAGILYNIGKAVYNALKVKPFKAIWIIIRYWLKIIYQLWNAVKYLITKTAISLDLVWNATSGEMIEDFVTPKEETLYGNGNVTVSAATGNLEATSELNKTGKGFSKFLTKVLGQEHCLKAWQKEQQFPINE